MRPWQSLNFLPLPQKHGSLRPILSVGDFMTGAFTAPRRDTVRCDAGWRCRLCHAAAIAVTPFVRAAILVELPGIDRTRECTTNSMTGSSAAW